MKVLAIDGNSVMNRAFYGVRPMQSSKGVFTHAIFGFINMIMKEVRDFQPDCVVTAFDLSVPTFRHKACAEYKANRHGMPDELRMQMPYIKEILPLMGFSIVTKEGFEADDVLGTIANLTQQAGGTCHILSGDRDILQLVTDSVTVRLEKGQGKTISYTPEVFREEYHLEPIHLIDLKAITGDSSDNYKGVPGIGEKGANALLAQYPTVEEIYTHLDTMELTKSVRTKLEAGKEQAEFCKWLATIKTDVDLGIAIEDLACKPMETEKLRGLLEELEMAKIIKDLLPANAESSTTDTPTISAEETTITESPLTAEILENLTENTAVLFDGTTATIYDKATAESMVYTTDHAELLKALFQRPRIVFSAKEQYRWLMQQGITPETPTAKDTDLVAYLLGYSIDEKKDGIYKLCVFLHTTWHEKQGDYANLVSLTDAYNQAYRMVCDQDMKELYDMERQLTIVLASMEHYGVTADRDGIETFGEMLREKIKIEEEQVYTLAGEEFNIGSPMQLGQILFEKLAIPGGKKTKRGYSTNADVLEKLKGKYPIVDSILRWRQYSKLNSTYVEGMVKQIEQDGRIHTIYKQTEARTGRISSAEPNLQNIPVRTELGREMRKFFIAAEGCTFLDADYSQIELRLMANLSGDTLMREAFLSGADIHTATAAQVFRLPVEMITPSMRSAAKAVNFGILYGMGAHSLSEDIHVSMAEAKKYIANYKAQFPKVDEFMENVVETAKNTGYVSTYFHRRRNIPELTATNKIVQAQGKRIAMNTPIQGTAADIIKLAMIHVYERLRREIPEAKLILQIHDELIVEIPENLAEQGSKILGEEMQQVLLQVLPAETVQQDFPVPLTADVKQGKSWYDAKG